VLEQLVVKPGTPAMLAARDPADRLGLSGKDDGRSRLEELLDDLRGLQARLWAEHRRSVLLVLQGVDASGKDGVIRSVWYVIPGDRNWVRNVAVATVLVEALRRLDPQFPQPDLEGIATASG
jgi:polyphosphate kinase 2 (PPK2 family)